VTLVYENLDPTTNGNWNSPMPDTDQPVLHACIIGVGRFANFPASQDVNRPSCADSARAMVDFLIRNKDNLAVPLGSIECLISDPRDAVDVLATLSRTDVQFDPREENDLTVEKGTKDKVRAATEQWTGRIRKGYENGQGISPGDHILLYVCSHGIAERDYSAYAVLEDTDPDPDANIPYEGVLDLQMFSQSAPAKTQAGAVWVFLDACQEVVPLASSIQGGVIGYPITVSSFPEQKACNVHSFCLVGSKYGGKAFAPKTGGVAYFTEALIAGLEKYCVERISGQWMSTSSSLHPGINQISEDVFSRPLETEPLKVPLRNTPFMKTKAPKVPIRISTYPQGVLRDSKNSFIRNLADGTTVATRPIEETEATWLCHLTPSFDAMQVQLDNPRKPESPYRYDFYADLPSRSVKVL